MHVQQRSWSPTAGWGGAAPDPEPAASLVLLFGGREALRSAEVRDELRRAWPGARVVGCTTAGDIQGELVSDDGAVATALTFEHTQVVIAEARLTGRAESKAAGARLAQALDHPQLAHVLVFSDGLLVNGSALVEGLMSALPPGVSVTGGLAGDGPRFAETLVVLDDEGVAGRVVAIGLVGPRLHVGYGSRGGWDPFGVEWEITRSEENVLYALDGRSALALYETYLGEHARDLPASALRFPIALRRGEQDAVVRTVLAIDHEAGSMTFAGDMPTGARARFMRANVDRLVEGADGAARTAHEALGGPEASLALLISCVGRKLVLQQRVEDELEAVREELGPGAVMAGFYSYGEISPFAPGASCALHNQTMTVTTLRES
jgi:hypothetical protein